MIGGVAQALLPAPVRLAPLAAAAVAVVLRELGMVRFAVPENRRLVPEDAQHRGRVLGPVQFGFEMGTGMRTYSPSALPDLVLLSIVLAMPLTGALVAGAGFALARFLMPMVSNAHSDDGSLDRSVGRPSAESRRRDGTGHRGRARHRPGSRVIKELLGWGVVGVRVLDPDARNVQVCETNVS